MDTEVDRRNKLDAHTFAFRVSKDKKVFISYNGKQVMILQGDRAEHFISRINGAEDKEAQRIMAKATGNFERGNEKANRKN